MALDLSALNDIDALLRAQDMGNGLRSVSVDAINPDPNQPRKSFDEESLLELAESIRAVGIIQPPVVRTRGEGYLLISGERRWRAASQLGMRTIEVIVRDDLGARAQLVENIQRDALSTWEIYRWIASELDAGAKQIELATAIGKSKQWVSAYASIANMPEPFITALRDSRVEDITALGHLCRLHKERPEVAARLLESPMLITRRAVADAFAQAPVHDPTVILEVPPKAPTARAHPARTPSESAGGDQCCGIGKEADAVPTSKRLESLPIRIVVRYEGRSWIVNYTEQAKGANGARTVMVEDEEGAVRYAPFDDLKLQGIEDRR